ncbi:MAG: T9SS type A sorting domain-containing protein [Dysgonamonadaceae bacterium]|jgi:sialate O-acetylesterase|nr:T9SS type A sorting domain-containing protein [Dysgonamonadaceae bacterium]
MKKTNFLLLIFCLFCSSAAFSADKIEKVVGVITNKTTVGRFGPDGNDYYGFQSYYRTLNIDASQSQFENLVLKMRVYIDNLDNPGDISFIQQAGFAMIELANEMTPTDTYVQWGIKTLGLQHGWTDLYLPLTTGDKKANFDLTKPLNWFRFGFARIPGEPDALQIRLADVQLVDKSILVDPPTNPEDIAWNTDYLIADVPYTNITGEIKAGFTNGFSIGRAFDPIDASAHNPKQIYLQINATITEQTPGDIYILSRVSGQIELTSSGRADVNESLWGIGSVDWKAGAHSYTLALANAGKTGGDLDLANINFMRIYAVSVPTDFAGKITMNVTSVKLIDLTNQTKLTTLFNNKMMFQQNKPINIWGYATAGKNITVNFYKGETLLDTQNATVPESGKWQVTFASQPASYDKYKFEVKEGENLIQTVEDILVGEVWLSSGQSNMALNVAGTIDGQALMANANNDNIRFFLESTATNAPYKPNTDIPGAYWGSGNDGMQVGKVSAVAYSMAVKLQEELNIPIGIINTAVGSSVIEAWLPSQDIENDPALTLDLKRLGLYFDEEFYPEGTNQMSSYYNLKIHPLLGYNITGLIWYQGESNSSRPQLYAREINLLKKSYEQVFGFTNNDMPLIYCQVAPWVQTLENPQYLSPLAEAFYDGWAMNPETMALLPIYDTDLTYVGNVVIHPTNKTPVGKRFATAALNLVYNGGGEYTAPVFDEMTIEGNKIIVKFAHVGEGLKSTNGLNEIRGFALCGEDGVFVGAKARIISANEVEVWNNRVENPKQVTYAWASFNITSNLANSVGIAAAPFRSDRSAGYKFYNPQDWTFADGQIWGVDVADFVGFIPAWKNAPVSGVATAAISFDETTKSEGKASLKVQYPANDGVVGVGPILSNKTTVSQLSNFNVISVDALNPDGKAKEIELLIKDNTNKIYKAIVAGEENTANPATAISLAQNTRFSTLAFYIKQLKNEQNAVVTDVTTILNNVQLLQFTVNDNEAGSIYFDNVQFGMLSQSLGLAIGSVSDEAGIQIWSSKNGINIRGNSSNLLQKVEIFDLQGRKIYSKTGMNDSEFSCNLAAGSRILIVKAQTGKTLQVQKVVL